MSQRNSFLVEKQRMLAPAGELCLFGCLSCSPRGGEVGLSWVPAADILASWRQFAERTPFETIQFGSDEDPFARPERGIGMLTQLARMDKYVNFSTKATLDSSPLDAIGEVRHHMRALETTLSARGHGVPPLPEAHGMCEGAMKRARSSRRSRRERRSR
ncbi:MAG TPA: hypothetical protein VKR06_11310 [Ktedonosporobacter sp.]|nr:hypothetical protein [Ktedonosporobacter sp.]